MSDVCAHGSLKRQCELCEKDERIRQLEVGLRRAIHLVETIRPMVMWPMDDEIYGDGPRYDEEWASISLDLVKEALEP